MRSNQKVAQTLVRTGLLNKRNLNPFQLLLTLLTTPLFALALVFPGAAMAAYTDPIDLPAVKYATAAQAMLIDVAAAGQRLVAVGERGTIVYSDDQGGNWTQADVETSAHLNAVYFVDDQQGWAVGEDAVVLSTKDGGVSWQRQHDARDADTKGPLLDVYFKNAQEGFAVGVFNKFYVTTDGGATWQNAAEQVDNIDEWHLTGIAAGANEVIYISSEAGITFRSADGGETFAPMEVPTGGTNFGLLVRQNAAGQDEIVLFGIGGIMYVSLDASETWKQIETGTKLNLLGGNWAADGSATFAGTDGLVMHLDSSLTKATLVEPPFPAPFGSALTVGNEIVVVGFGGANLIDNSAAVDQPKAE